MSSIKDVPPVKRRAKNHINFSVGLNTCTGHRCFFCSRTIDCPGDDMCWIVMKLAEPIETCRRHK